MLVSQSLQRTHEIMDWKTLYTIEALNAFTVILFTTKIISSFTYSVKLSWSTEQEPGAVSGIQVDLFFQYSHLAFPPSVRQWWVSLPEHAV